MIYTVTGAISEPGPGSVLIHDHIRCLSNDMLHTFGKSWLDEEKFVEYAAQVLRQLKKEYGISLFVDGTPIDMGRDIRFLAAVSEKAEVPIVASTGFYYFPSCVTNERTPEDLAEWLLRDCQNAENCGVRPGILKCASDTDGMTADNIKRLTALGIVQRETGLPLYVHCIHTGNMAHEQIDILTKAGADPDKILMGHSARRPDADYWESIICRGCRVVVDQCHCVPYSLEKIGGELAELCRRGLAESLLIGNDLCMYCDFGRVGNLGTELTVEEQTKRFGHMFEKVMPAFYGAGGDPEECEHILRENALCALNV